MKQDESTSNFGQWKVAIELVNGGGEVFLTGSQTVIEKWKTLNGKIKYSSQPSTSDSIDYPDPKKRKFTAQPAIIRIPSQDQKSSVDPTLSALLKDAANKANTPEIVFAFSNLTKEGSKYSQERRLTRERSVDSGEDYKLNFETKSNPLKSGLNLGKLVHDEYPTEFFSKLRGDSPQSQKLFEKQKVAKTVTRIYEYTTSHGKQEVKNEDIEEEEQEEESSDCVLSEDFPITFKQEILTVYRIKTRLDPNIEFCWMDPTKNDLIICDLENSKVKVYRSEFCEPDPSVLQNVKSFIYLNSELGKLFPMLQQIIKTMKPKEYTNITLNFELFKTVIQWIYTGTVTLQNPAKFLLDIRDLKYDTLIQFLIPEMMGQLRKESPKRFHHFMISWLDDAIHNDLLELRESCLLLLQESFCKETIQSLAWVKMRVLSVFELYKSYYKPLTYQMDVALDGIDAFQMDDHKKSVIRTFVSNWSFN